jgi:short subunit dehydrogenase-like uncharacterized protein
MPGSIVVFGATGYTGRLAAEALVRRGVRPVLAARNPDRLTALAAELGGLESEIADVDRPDSVRALVTGDDVLVSTVGPFIRWGAPAIQAAIDSGATYIDSTGEPPFIRDVFERYDEPARASGAGLLTAMGYDYVPGNLAAALAMERAGDTAVKVAVGYFITGRASPREAMSGGTFASLTGVLLSPHFGYRDGSLVTERGAKRVRTFTTASGKKLTGASVGSSEHFSLPRIYPTLREVDAYLGWFGPASKAMQAMSVAGEVAAIRNGVDKLGRRFVKGSTGGPDEAARSRTGSLVIAEAFNASGTLLARVELKGVNGYTFTGEMLAWAAQRALEHGVHGAGALGPVEAFGLHELEAGCAEIGLAADPAATTASSA